MTAGVVLVIDFEIRCVLKWQVSLSLCVFYFPHFLQYNLKFSKILSNLRILKLYY